MRKSGSSRNFSRSLLLSLALSALGCAKSPPVPILATEAQDLLRSLSVGRAELKSIRAEAKADLRSGGKKLRVLLSMLVVYPNRLFLEAGGVGMAPVQVAMDGDTITVWLPGDGRAFQGSGASAMRAVWGLSIAPHELIEILLGYLPPVPTEITKAVRAKRQWLVTSESPERSVTLAFDRRSGRLQSYLERKPRSLELSFAEPLQTAVGVYHAKLGLVSAAGSLQLAFRDLETNPKIPNAHLKLDLPPGIRFEPIEVLNLLKGRS